MTEIRLDLTSLSSQHCPGCQGQVLAAAVFFTHILNEVLVDDALHESHRVAITLVIQSRGLPLLLLIIRVHIVFLVLLWLTET